MNAAVSLAREVEFGSETHDAREGATGDATMGSERRDPGTLAQAALDVLGFSRSGEAQVGGVLGKQAQHEYRIGKVEQAVERIETKVDSSMKGQRSLQRAQYLMTVLIIAWLGMQFYDRWQEHEQFDRAQSSERGR